MIIVSSQYSYFYIFNDGCIHMHKNLLVLIGGLDWIGLCTMYLTNLNNIPSISLRSLQDIFLYKKMNL